MDKLEKLVLERKLAAPVDKVWKMWTTKSGLERWWGPDGFETKVSALDVRVGGRFEMVMTALKPEIVAHLQSMGMPASQRFGGDYVIVDEGRRLVYDMLVDFCPACRRVARARR